MEKSSSRTASPVSADNKYAFKIFIGGINPKATYKDIIYTLRNFGSIEKVLLKSRAKGCPLNLGYGYLMTNNESLYKKLLEHQLYQTEYGRLEF